MEKNSKKNGLTSGLTRGWRQASDASAPPHMTAWRQTRQLNGDPDANPMRETVGTTNCLLGCCVTLSYFGYPQKDWNHGKNAKNCWVNEDMKNTIISTSFSLSSRGCKQGLLSSCILIRISSCTVKKRGFQANLTVRGIQQLTKQSFQPHHCGVVGDQPPWFFFFTNLLEKCYISV